MAPPVVSKVTSCCKRFLTIWARERFRIAVCSLVYLQVLCCIEHSVTTSLTTYESLITPVIVQGLYSIMYDKILFQKEAVSFNSGGIFVI